MDRKSRIRFSKVDAIRLVAGPACLVAWLLTAGGSTSRADDLAVLPTADSFRDVVRQHFRTLAHAALDRRLAHYESLKTDAQIVAWQQRLRTAFVDSIGGPLPRTPLNARVTGTVPGDGYRIEKVIFESCPGFLVTANLYLPEPAANESDGGVQKRWPAVLVPCGHSENGKAYGSYQRVCMLLARNGIAAFIFDPPGQGERKQVLKADEHGDHTAEGEWKSTSEHMVTGIAPILLGRGLATCFIHDGLRAIDYLASRPDIDASRIGCTGNSGGGNQTSYLMALDDRIVAAAPGNFITTTRIKNDRPGPGDAEQNIFGQTAYCLDHADFILLRAPRPTLILAATQDFVPVEGSWIAYREAQRMYSRMGFAERIALAEADAPHGYNSELRVAMVRFMRLWLTGQNDPVEEVELPLATDKQLACTSRGQVLLEPGARSIFDLNREEAERLRREREPRWQAVSLDERRSLVRSATGIRPLDELDEPTVIRRLPITHRTSSNELVVAERILLIDHSADGFRPAGFSPAMAELTTPLASRHQHATDLPLPTLLFRPQSPSGQAVLYLHSAGKSLHLDADILPLLKSGRTVLAVDVAGIGETAMRPWRYGTMSDVLDVNSAEFFVAYMLGRSFVALRAEQILICSRWLAAQDGITSVSLQAEGVLCVPALHAAALEPQQFRAVKLTGGLSSWQSVIETELPRAQLTSIVHGALRTCDLPDLMELLEDMPVEIEAPVTAAGQR